MCCGEQNNRRLQKFRCTSFSIPEAPPVADSKAAAEALQAKRIVEKWEALISLTGAFKV
jgi:hypothetical protein